VRIARALTTSVYRSLRTWLSGIAKAGLASRVPSSAEATGRAPPAHFPGDPAPFPPRPLAALPGSPAAAQPKGAPASEMVYCLNQSQAGGDKRPRDEKPWNASYSSWSATAASIMASPSPKARARSAGAHGDKPRSRPFLAPAEPRAARCVAVRGDHFSDDAREDFLLSLVEAHRDHHRSFENRATMTATSTNALTIPIGVQSAT
jgi:hypothetical protein